MDFQHTEDRRMLADTLNRFIAEQYAFPVRDRIAQSAEGFDRAMWRRRRLGALPKPTAGSAARARCFECPGAPSSSRSSARCSRAALSLAGGAAHRDRLAALIDGSASAAFAHDEPGSHYELTTVRTRAERSGDGWVLTGAKGVVDRAGGVLRRQRAGVGS